MVKVEKQTFTISTDKRSFLSLLGRMLKIYRHFNLNRRDLYHFISDKMSIPNMNELIEDIQRELYDYRFSNIAFQYFETRNIWSCTISYAYTGFAEGVGTSPDMALAEAYVKLKRQLSEKE